MPDLKLTRGCCFTLLEHHCHIWNSVLREWHIWFSYRLYNTVYKMWRHKVRRMPTASLKLQAEICTLHIYCLLLLAFSWTTSRCYCWESNCDLIWQKGTYSLFNYTALSANNFAIHSTTYLLEIFTDYSTMVIVIAYKYHFQRPSRKKVISS